jgi:hypothetical protein
MHFIDDDSKDNYQSWDFLDRQVEKVLKIGKVKEFFKPLFENNIHFEWACNNPNKIGHTVYDIKMLDIQKVFSVNKQYQSIIMVANKEEQKEIKHFSGSMKNLDLFWFC